MTKPMLHVRSPQLLLFCSIAAFFLLDGLIFRSGLYARISNPDGIYNTLSYVVMFENQRPPSGKKEVLMLGNSKIEHAFSIADFALRYPQSGIEVVRGSAPATEERSWYYTLQHVDPNHDRYAAIVIPLVNYKITSSGPGGDSVQMLGPILSSREWPDYVASIFDDATRMRVALLGVFTSHNYAADFQDMLMHFQHRIKILQETYEKKSAWEDDRYIIRRDKNGKVVGTMGWDSLEGFVYDPATQKVLSYPEGMNEHTKHYTANYFNALSDLDADTNMKRGAEFTSYWLNKIAAAYQNSKTKLIVVQTGREPFPLPTRRVLPNSPDVRDMLPKRDSIVYLDDNTFAVIEKPYYYYDPDHLNYRGADIYTDILAKHLIRILQ